MKRLCPLAVTAAMSVLGILALASAEPTSRPFSAQVALRDGVSYTIDDAVERSIEFPNTFTIPPAARREGLAHNELAKVMFRITADGTTWVERMWVIVDEPRDANGVYVGTLDNDAFRTDAMRQGLRVRFEGRHVIDIFEKAPASGPAASQPSTIDRRTNRWF